MTQIESGPEWTQVDPGGFEANIGGVYGVSASDKVDADDWGGEADLVGIAQPSRPSRPFKTQIDQLCSG